MSGILSPNEAVKHADTVLASKGRSFHWARHLLGQKHAERATRLYAFCRYLDDLTDEASSTSVARTKLASVREEILNGKSRDTSLSDGLALVRECGIPVGPILDLVRGTSSDLERVCVGDLPELIRYCYRVAGTVGLMMCRVLDVESHSAFPHAIDLGIAMQLTNICRDVVEDASMGRRYLPATLVGDLTPEELIHPDSVVRSKVSAAILNLLHLADEYYKSGEAGLCYLPVRARGAILVASRIYRGIGTALLDREGDCWSNRAMVSAPQKAFLSFTALTSQPLKRSFWFPTAAHCAELHAALEGFTIST